MSGPQKLPEFEALARQMKGRSPVRGSLLLLAITGLLLFAFAWAALTEIDDVTRADGRVVPSGDLQVIEAAENGVLLSLAVEEGQIVEAGDLLMELDAAQQTSQLGQEIQRAAGLTARIARLQAEIDGTELTFDAELAASAPDVLRSETALFTGRLAQLRSQVAILENQRRQRLDEIAGAETDLTTARTMLEIVSQERAMVEPLVQRGIEPQTTLLELRRSEAEWFGRLTGGEAALRRLRAALEEIAERIHAEEQAYRAGALADRAMAVAELAALKPLLPALQQRAERARITAPLRGVVNRIHRTTLGSLARAGEPLIEIVPLDENLRVEAFIAPQDIAFLYPGQPVKVKITAYDFARYGGLEGELIRIGADAVRRSERSEEEFFAADIRTRGQLSDRNGVPVQIMPGMVAQVDILSGRKTVLDYILTPVVKVKEAAFRE